MDGDRLNDRQRKWIEQALPRVAALARAMSHRLRHVSDDELQSAGHEGLVQAALRYDPATGVPFGAFAHYRARGAMIDAARRASPALRRRSRALRALQASQALLEQADKATVRPDVADTRTLHEKVAAAAELVAKTTAAVVIARLGPDDPDKVAEDDRSAEQALMDRELRDALLAELERCNVDERALVQALYFEGKTMHEFAALVGKSVSTVSRHHAKLIGRLSTQLRQRFDPP